MDKLSNQSTFKYAIYIYFIGIIITICYTYFLYNINNAQFNIIIVMLLMTIVILFLNGYFSYKDPLNNFDIEIAQYSYVEQNARVFLTASLAIAMFFHFSGMDKKISTINSNAVYIPIIMSFICSCLILTIIWMPKTSGLYIRVLREFKTILLTLSIISLIIAMANTMVFGIFYPK